MCRVVPIVSKLTARTNQLYIAQFGDEEPWLEVGFHAFLSVGFTFATISALATSFPAECKSPAAVCG